MENVLKCDKCAGTGIDAGMLEIHEEFDHCFDDMKNVLNCCNCEGTGILRVKDEDAVDIRYTKDCIIISTAHTTVYLKDYNPDKLQEFVDHAINCPNYDCGVHATLNVDNGRYLSLVYSCYYRFENGVCIDTLFTGNTENETITLFDKNHDEILKFKHDTKLFQKLNQAMNE